MNGTMKISPGPRALSLTFPSLNTTARSYCLITKAKIMSILLSRRVFRRGDVWASGQSFCAVLAQVALEQAAVSLLVAEDRDHHVLRDPVEAVSCFDDAVVVVDRAGLGLDHTLDHVDDVGLVLGRLE